MGFPIRKSTGHRLFASNRSLSQLIASFFGSWCQGIHPVLLLAWPKVSSLWKNIFFNISFDIITLCALISVTYSLVCYHFTLRCVVPFGTPLSVCVTPSDFAFQLFQILWLAEFYFIIQFSRCYLRDENFTFSNAIVHHRGVLFFLRKISTWWR